MKLSHKLLAAFLAGWLPWAAPLWATLVDVPTGFYYPTISPANLGDYAASVTLTIDAAAEKVGMICRVNKTGNIAKIFWRINAVTTNDTLYGVIQTVAGTGFPSGTAYGGCSSGTVVTSGAGVYSVTLGAVAAAVKGDEIAVVIGYNAYVAGNMTVSTIANETSARIAYPYLAHFTAAWARNQIMTPAIWLEYDDGTYAMIPASWSPAASGPFVSATYNSGSTPDEYAMVFTPQFDCRIAGWAALLEFTAGADFNAILYEDTVAVATSTVDGDSFGNQNSAYWYTGIFPTPYTASGGTTYRIAIQATSGAASVILHRFISYSTQAMDQSFGGAGVYESTRTNKGAWTNNTSTRPFISAFIDQVDDGSGGGSGGAKSMFFMD